MRHAYGYERAVSGSTFFLGRDGIWEQQPDGSWRKMETETMNESPLLAPIVPLSCGCTFKHEGDDNNGSFEFVFCPMHEAAPALLEAAKAVIYASDDCRGHRYCNHSMQPWHDLRAAVRKAEDPTRP